MERIVLVCRNVVICFTFIFSTVFSPVLLIANECGHCVLCEEVENEDADYEMYRGFEEAFARFEIESEESTEEVNKKGFLKKWCKKLKKWFAKKAYKIFKKISGVKKIRNGEECAYTIAKFKRKIDKKIHHTGKIDKMFKKFDEHVNDPSYHEMSKFKERVSFYYNNKGVKPPDHEEESDEHADYLKEIPFKALVGGVGVACGSIIFFIPFPGCAKLGTYVVESGVALIIYGYVEKGEKDREEQKNK